MRVVRVLVPGLVATLLVLGVPFPAEAATPSLRVADLLVYETQSVVTKTVRVTRSSPTSTRVTVKFRTVSGTAVAPADYAARSLTTLTFLPGQVTKLVTVKVAGDTKDEADETFKLVLSSPVGAKIADSTGVVTIRDNDAPPVLSLLTTSVVEGSTGLVTRTLTMRLSAPSGRSARVTWGLASGTAVLSSDVDWKSGVLIFPIGATTRTLSVTVHGDKNDEPNEYFTVRLVSPLNVRLATAYPRVNLLDDDAPLSPTLLGFTPAVGTSQDVVLTGAAPSGTSVLVYPNATCVGTATLEAPAASLASGIALVAAPNAVSSYAARTRNARSELSACSNAVSYTHDAIAPSAPSGLAIVGGSPGNNNSLVVTGASEAGTSVQAYTDACQSSPIASGTATALAGAGISLGQVADNTSTTWWFDAVDAAGNRSGCSSPLTFVEDSTPPGVIADVGLPNGVTGVGTQPVVVGTAEPGSVVSFYALAAGGSTCEATPLVTASAAELLAGVRVPFVARATTTRAVVVRDAAGNTSSPCGPASTITYTETSTETEPNDTAGTANVGATTVGVADQYGEVESFGASDFYTVTVPELGSIRAETLSVPGGAECKYSVPSSLNSKVRIRTTAGVLLATNDDGGPGPCSLVMASLLSAGTYVVEVTSSADAVAAKFPLGYHLKLTVADAPTGILESEPNDTLAAPHSLGSYTGTPIDVNGRFGTATDQDVFSFVLGSATTLTFEATDGSGSGSCVGVGIGLEVFNSAGTLVASASYPADMGVCTDPPLTLSSLPADTYRVRVNNLLVEKTYGYHLRVRA